MLTECYGMKRYVSIRSATIEQGSRIVRQAIYNSLVLEIQTINLSGQIIIDGMC
jgi:hypothetical protein